MSASTGAVFRIPAPDGGSVAGWRKCGDGPPVIFLHGLAVNARIWDVPDLPAPEGGFAFRSLAALLHAQGYDCWLPNFRGHGAPDALSEPAAGQRDWCVDHFAAVDLPAMVAHVQRETGQRPVLIGNSMGAMVTCAWLLGATIDPADAAVTLSDSAAAARHASIRGCVLVEFPAALRWPNSAYDADGRLRWRELLSMWGSDQPGRNGACSAGDGRSGSADEVRGAGDELRSSADEVRSAGDELRSVPAGVPGATAESEGMPRDPVTDRNFPFELLSNSWVLQAIMSAGGTIDLKWMRSTARQSAETGSQSRWLRWLDERIAAAAGFISERLKGSRHFSAETFTHGLRAAVDHMKSGVLDQMGRSVRARGFVSGLGAPPVSYSDAYPRIRAPLLVVIGGRDRIANAEVVRTDFFERVSSEDKRLLRFPDLAHGDFEYAPRAYSEVYPGIMAWVHEQCSASALEHG
ncbi:MAG: alpha/beta fold hydrolase [Phycisphaerales bacterium]|nr:alpha/beta fold hydrolase [Phycisphaerales bacterium]